MCVYDVCVLVRVCACMLEVVVREGGAYIPHKIMTYQKHILALGLIFKAIIKIKYSLGNND